MSRRHRPKHLIAVKDCDDCPLADGFDQNCHATTPPRMFPRRGLPRWCPLRAEQVVVALEVAR